MCFAFFSGAGGARFFFFPLSLFSRSLTHFSPSFSRPSLPKYTTTHTTHNTTTHNHHDNNHDNSYHRVALTLLKAAYRRAEALVASRRTAIRRLAEELLAADEERVSGARVVEIIEVS